MCRLLLIVLLQVLLCTDVAITQLIPYRTVQFYDFVNRLHISDIKRDSHSSGYRIIGRLSVQSVWNSDDRQIIRFELDSLKLSTIKSGQFQDVQHSQLDSLTKRQFYLLLNDQEAREFYTDEEKDVSLQNLQKGIASLFQFKVKDSVVYEEDVSGRCNVLYKKHSSTGHSKIKSECANWSLKLHRSTERPLDINAKSYQEIEYKLSQDGILFKLTSTERHTFGVAMNNLLGRSIESVTTLQHTGSDEIHESISGMNPKMLSSSFVGSGLEAEVDGNVRTESADLLSESIKLHQNELSDENLGTQALGLLFIRLLPLARHAGTEELMALLKSSSYADISNQLIDLLGTAQTKESHSAIMTIFKFNRYDDFLFLEKYLQALAIGTRPSKHITEDLLHKLQSKKFENEKLKETTLLTVSAMAYKYSQLSPSGADHPLYGKVRTHIFNELKKCNSNECKAIFIRCLQNLKDMSTVQTLIKMAVTESRTLSVAAMKALRTFPVEKFTAEHRKYFESIFYQSVKRYDSSARTLAIDILLDMKPSGDQLANLLRYLSGPDKEFEVKTYLLQKVKMFADQCPKFAALVRSVLDSCAELRNYDILAQKGLTTALRRQYSRLPAFNGSLVSIQEVNKGVLKRGLVEMMIEADGETVNVFTLGIYTNGLSSFMGGSDDANEEELSDEDDIVTAGMELSVLGTQLRPLVFFSGQAELMGHVWSGIASDATPAYQATFLIHDHEEYIVLQNGATVYVNVLSANSIDLNGLVQISLWNRNAHTEIKKNSALAIQGSTTIVNSFISLKGTFVSTSEPKVSLIADIDFYSDIKLCIQLQRVPSKVWVRLVDSQAAPSSEQKDERVVNISYRLPGFTMALNQKNNEMCNVIFA